MCVALLALSLQSKRAFLLWMVCSEVRCLIDRAESDIWGCIHIRCWRVQFFPGLLLSVLLKPNTKSIHVCRASLLYKNASVHRNVLFETLSSLDIYLLRFCSLLQFKIVRYTYNVWLFLSRLPTFILWDSSNV